MRQNDALSRYREDRDEDSRFSPPPPRVSFVSIAFERRFAPRFPRIWNETDKNGSVLTRRSRPTRWPTRAISNAKTILLHIERCPRRGRTVTAGGSGSGSGGGGGDASAMTTTTTTTTKTTTSESSVAPLRRFATIYKLRDKSHLRRRERGPVVTHTTVTEVRARARARGRERGRRAAPCRAVPKKRRLHRALPLLLPLLLQRDSTITIIYAGGASTVTF